MLNVKKIKMHNLSYHTFFEFLLKQCYNCKHVIIETLVIHNTIVIFAFAVNIP